MKICFPLIFFFSFFSNPQILDIVSKAEVIASVQASNSGQDVSSLVQDEVSSMRKSSPFVTKYLQESSKVSLLLFFCLYEQSIFMSVLKPFFFLKKRNQHFIDCRVSCLFKLVSPLFVLFFIGAANVLSTDFRSAYHVHHRCYGSFHHYISFYPDLFHYTPFRENEKAYDIHEAKSSSSS